MMDMLRKEFEEKQALHNELVSEYNSKMESKKKVEAEMDYPGQIKVNIIRETRVVDYAK